MSETTERPGRRVARLRAELADAESQRDAAARSVRRIHACRIERRRRADDDLVRAEIRAGDLRVALAAARRERWRLGEAITRAGRLARDVGLTSGLRTLRTVSTRMHRYEWTAWTALERLSALADRLAREVPEAALQRERAARQEGARKRREGQQP